MPHAWCPDRQSASPRRRDLVRAPAAGQPARRWTPTARSGQGRAGEPAAGPTRAATSRRGAAEPTPSRGVDSADRQSSRRRPGGPRSPSVWPGPHGPPCWRGRSARPSRPRPGARPGRRPRRRGAPRRRDRVRAPRRSGPRGRRSARTGCGSRIAPGLRRHLGRATRAVSYATVGDNPRRHGRHQGVVEVAEQRPEPAVRGHAVGVDERDEGAVHRSQPGVARPGRSDVRGQPDEGGTMAFGDLLGRARIGRGVVHHDAGQTLVLHAVEQPVELLGPVVHRHHDGDVGEPQAARGRPGVESAAGHQPPRQHLRRTARPNLSAVLPAFDQLPGPLGQPEQAKRTAAEQDGPAVERPRRRVLASR